MNDNPGADIVRSVESHGGTAERRQPILASLLFTTNAFRLR